MSLAQDLRSALSEPRYQATIEDYDRWLWGLGPEKVRALLDVETVLSVDLEDGTVLELPAVYAGLLRAWADYCREQGWQDRAFAESDKRLEAELLASIEAASLLPGDP